MFELHRQIESISYGIQSFDKLVDLGLNLARSSTPESFSWRHFLKKLIVYLKLHEPLSFISITILSVPIVSF